VKEAKNNCSLDLNNLTLYDYFNLENLEKLKHNANNGTKEDIKKFCLTVFQLYKRQSDHNQWQWNHSQREIKLQEVLYFVPGIKSLLPDWFYSTLRNYQKELVVEKKQVINASTNKQSLYSKQKAVDTYNSMNSTKDEPDKKSGCIIM